MISKLAGIGLAALACASALGQTTQTPAIDAAGRFEIADVHVTPKALANTFMEANPPHDGHYEFHSASMIDLIRLAYEFDDDRILGGPSWLKMDRFDVIAKVPAGTNVMAPPGTAQGTLSAAVRAMLQALLADRFKLVIREETRPLPGYALIVDKKAQTKEADGSGDTGCRYMPPTDPADTTARFACRNMSMEAFAGFLPRLISTPSAAVIDKTELKGQWNFDLKLPRNALGQSLGNEINRQLGLKLEPQPIPTQVAVVGSANETPTANVPGVAEALPMAPQPTAFDVATFKPTDPAYSRCTISLNPQPGGLWSSRGLPLSALLVRAFSPSFAQRNEDLVVGVPAASDPNGGLTIDEALEKQLGLKLESQKRPMTVTVIDHLEQTPTDN